MKELQELMTALNERTKHTDLRQTFQIVDGPLGFVPEPSAKIVEGIIDGAVKDMIGADGIELLETSAKFLRGESHLVIKVGVKGP